MWRKSDIDDRLKGKPHLLPVYGHTLNIPERLRLNDKNLFVVFNRITQKFEIHSLENKGNSFSLNVPFRELDARVEDFVRKYDIRRHGRKIFDDMDRHNEELDEKRQRDRQKEVNEFARETYERYNNSKQVQV